MEILLFNKPFLIKKFSLFFKKKFLKIRRRLSLVFYRFKHIVSYFFGIKPCFCNGDHDTKLIENFRPKIRHIFNQFIKTNFATDWLKNKGKLARLCDKTVQGAILIFNDQFLAAGDFDFLWLKTCKNEHCRGCELDFEPGVFCWDLFNDWSKKINSKAQNNPDIRIAWEFSRLQFLIPLAISNFYGFGQDKENEFVKKVIESWISNNGYLTGPNWTCAMEASIRAVNLIWIVCLMDLGQEFSSKIVRGLCLHGAFISDCFEDFDRPNNHVLADLIGLAYINDFLGNQKALKRNLEQFSDQIDRQISDDGSSYEGSTGYHRLVCEMFLHALALSDLYDDKTFKKLESKKEKIFNFLQSCHDNKAQMVQIGDLDSSKFVFGLQTEPILKKSLEIEFFQNFGVAFFKSENIFSSFKLPTGNKSQPTGHFHLDWLSITLQLAGVDIFVDSGSGFYSKDPNLRNYFRSFQAHSTVFASEFEKNAFARSSAFCLDEFVDSKFFEKGKTWASAIYRKDNFEISRRLDFFCHEQSNEKAYKVIIFDKVWGDASTDFVTSFIIDPNLTVEQHNSNFWSLKLGDKKFSLKSDLKFVLGKALISRGYGVIEPTNRLFCQTKSSFNSTIELSGPL